MTTNDPTNRPLPKPRRRHGLGADGIEALRSRQGGGCAICQKPETEAPGGRLAVDHDHAHCPGKIGCPLCVRGLLCVNCNNLLRSARDDQRILRAAIDYVAGQRQSTPATEDLPVIEVLHGLGREDADPRLMPRQGRRDRFFMLMARSPRRGCDGRRGRMDAGQRPAGLPRRDPAGRLVLRRTRRSRCLPREGSAANTRRRSGRAFFQEVAMERAKLGMSSPGLPGGQVTLRDVNAYLHAQAHNK